MFWHVPHCLSITELTESPNKHLSIIWHIADPDSVRCSRTAGQIGVLVKRSSLSMDGWME